MLLAFGNLMNLKTRKVSKERIIRIPNQKPEKRKELVADMPLFDVVDVPLTVVERRLLEEGNSQLQKLPTLIKERVPSDPNLLKMVDAVNVVINNAYQISDTINRELKTRRKAVRDLVLQQKKVPLNKPSTQKTSILPQEWSQAEAVILGSKLYLDSLENKLKSIGFTSSQETGKVIGGFSHPGETLITEPLSVKRENSFVE
jgi:hypothetical protein